MFHAKENLYFGRREGRGFVRLVKFEVDGGAAPHTLWIDKDGATLPSEYPFADGTFRSVKVVLDVTFTPEEWASIVASVSRGGESDGRYYKALEFHGEGFGK